MGTEVIIIKELQRWSELRKKLVVGIDGYSGAGKTTLLKKIAGKHDFIQPVHMDDFATTANTKENLIPQIKNGNKSLKLEWKPADGLERLTKLIRDFRLEQTGKVLLIEGIFLCHEKVLRNELDKIIYLDTNKEEADKRRVKREKERWGEKYFPEDHPDSFARLFKIAFNRYEELYEPKRNADLVVSLTD